MTNIPDQSRFESMYETGAPWDIGRPQQPFVEVAGEITGHVLDAGCGTGALSLFLASRGNEVTGIDFLAGPIERAQQQAIERGLAITFLVKDALTLSQWDRRFDNAVDSGLFHVFSDDARAQYVHGLTTVVTPGGRLFLQCFSIDEPGPDGPRRVSESELRNAFNDGWIIESIKATRFETRTDLPGISFSEGGPKSWFLTARRI
ncbi:MAG: class I SAM-dependent methyltransferase [Pirellulales bacterium]